MITGIGNEVLIGVTVLIIPVFGILYYIVEHVFYRNESGEQFNENNFYNQEPPRVRDPCPICLDTTKFTVQTNCSHCFCGLCFKRFYDQGNVSRVRCPLCRSHTTTIISRFTRDELEAPDTSTLGSERITVRRFMDGYNRSSFLAGRSVAEVIRDVPFIMRHMFSDLLLNMNIYVLIRWKIYIVLLSTLIYFISPLDLIPEAMFGIIGFLDDILVIVTVVTYLSIIYRHNMINVQEQ